MLKNHGPGGCCCGEDNCLIWQTAFAEDLLSADWTVTRGDEEDFTWDSGGFATIDAADTEAIATAGAASPYAISAKVRIRGTDGAHARIVIARDDDGAALIAELQIGTDCGELYLYERDAAGVETELLNRPIDLAISGEWHSLSACYDPETGRFFATVLPSGGRTHIWGVELTDQESGPGAGIATGPGHSGDVDFDNFQFRYLYYYGGYGYERIDCETCDPDCRISIQNWDTGPNEDIQCETETVTGSFAYCDTYDPPKHSTSHMFGEGKVMQTVDIEENYYRATVVFDALDVGITYSLILDSSTTVEVWITYADPTWTVHARINGGTEHTTTTILEPWYLTISACRYLDSVVADAGVMDITNLAHDVTTMLQVVTRPIGAVRIGAEISGDDSGIRSLASYRIPGTFTAMGGGCTDCRVCASQCNPDHKPPGVLLLDFSDATLSDLAWDGCDELATVYGLVFNYSGGNPCRWDYARTIDSGVPKPPGGTLKCYLTITAEIITDGGNLRWKVLYGILCESYTGSPPINIGGCSAYYYSDTFSADECDDEPVTLGLTDNPPTPEQTCAEKEPGTPGYPYGTICRGDLPEEIVLTFPE